MEVPGCCPGKAALRPGNPTVDLPFVVYLPRVHHYFSFVLCLNMLACFIIYLNVD